MSLVTVSLKFRFDSIKYEFQKSLQKLDFVSNSFIKNITNTESLFSTKSFLMSICQIICLRTIKLWPLGLNWNVQNF